MATTEKAISIVRELTDKLTVRLSSLSVVQGFGTAGDPTINIGAGGAGGQNAFIRVVPVTSIQKDVLGLAQNVYTPHKMQIAVEAGSSGLTVDTWATLAPILFEGFARGTIIEIWTSTNTNPPIESAFAGTNASLSITLDNLYWPMSGQ